MKIKFLKLPDYVQEVVDSTLGCKQALRNLELGRPSTPRFKWLCESKNDEYIPHQVEQVLNSMQDLPEISEWDLGFKPKYGPQGEAAPLADRLEGFDEYFAHLESSEFFDQEVWKQAKRLAVKKLGFNQSGHPVSVESIIDRCSKEGKYGTNSGFDKYVKKKDPKAQSAAIADYKTCISRKFPNTPGTRATPGKTGVNARNIFMTAFAVVLNGQRFQYPLQQYITDRNIEFFAPWKGFDKYTEIAATFLRDTWKFSVDKEKMDQHFNIHHAKEAYDVGKYFFAKEHWDELWTVIEYVFTQPILTNLGWIDQDHALVSGESWTNLIETLFNYIFEIYMSLKYHIEIRHSCGIGDDEIIEFGLRVRTEKDALWVKKTWLREMAWAKLPGNDEKNVMSQTEFFFCQRGSFIKWNGHDGKLPWAPVYRLYRLAEMTEWPENFHNDYEGKKVKVVDGKKKMVRNNLFNWSTAAIQVLMKAENALHHPKFYWWLDFVWREMPALRRFIKLKDSDVLAAEQRARKITGFLPTYNQEKADKPLTSFVGFQYLRRKLR